MQHTNQYQFNLIESGDTFSPQPLNENMEKVEAALSAQLNCITGTYTGNGTYGESNPNTLTFPFEPKLVIIMSELQFCLFTRGVPKGLGRSNAVIKADRYIQSVFWIGNTMSWFVTAINSSESSHTTNSTHQMNANGTTYSYLAIG